jgi:tetratricopeptide (TPR) repeat protein
MKLNYIILFLCFIVSWQKNYAQINTEQVTLMGRHALYFDDYLTAIRHFNRVIETKPYLEKPYYYRAYAKFNLDDFKGAEADCDLCIERNPFLTEVYQLRGLCRIHNNDMEGAINDYTKVLLDNPSDHIARYNRALCLMEKKDHSEAENDINQLLETTPRNSKAFMVKAQLRMLQQDTAQAIKWTNDLLQLTPHNADAWNYRGRLAIAMEDFEKADSCLSKAIAIEPQKADHYQLRARTRHALNWFDKAIADYDVVIHYIPNHFVAHYNRGLLLATIGKHQEAINEFDYVLKEEPSNTLARYNRALLYEKTQNYQAAEADLTWLINDFPNFIHGYVMRAECRTRLGNKKGASEDEAFVQRATLNLRYGKASNAQIRKVVVETEKTLANYMQPAADPDTTTSLLNELIGKVQHLKHTRQPMGIIHLAIAQGRQSEYFHTEINHTNILQKSGLRLILTANEEHQALTPETREEALKILSKAIANNQSTTENLILRSLLHCGQYNFTDATDDAQAAIKTDTTSISAHLQQMYIHLRVAHTKTDNAEARRMQLLMAERQAQKILELTRAAWAPAHYNIACVQMLMDQKEKALRHLNIALDIDGNLAPAYFNKALILQDLKQYDEAEKCLSKAGELGIYKAYSIMKTKN